MDLQNLLKSNGNFWIVIDLDGTLCDCSARAHLAQAKQWDEFHSGIPSDSVILSTAFFLALASRSANVLLCTGRNEAHRKATEEWLERNGIAQFVDEMIMRSDGDWSSDHELKIKMLDEFFDGREEALARVLVVLDDRDKVVEAWRNAGFKCWQVAVGNY